MYRGVLASGLNLEQALSLLQAEREAYIELQHQAFADAAFLRSRLETEEQQCRGSEERIMQLDRWRAISELQAQHINNKYQQDVTERDVIITELKDRAKTLSQQNINAEVEIEGLRERYRQEMDAVVRLESTVSDTEAVRMELAERLSANARLDANREQYMHRFVDEARQSVDEFRNSERETESIQQRLFFEKTQELMVVEQKIAEQVALISRAEHNINEERAMLYRSQHESDNLRREVEEMSQERGKLRLELSSASKDSGTMRSEIDEMKQENTKLRVEFMRVTKDAGALDRKLMDKEDELRQLKVALQEANSAPSMSSWQHVNSPDDTEKRLLKAAIEEWQNTCEVMENKNASLRRRLDDQESFVEQLSSELSRQEKRMKELLRKENKSSSSSSQPTSKWGDSVQDLLKGGGAFHTNSTMNSALASAGAPLFDTITNTQYQGNVGILQLASFGRASGGGDGVKSTGGTGNGDDKDSKGKSDSPDVGQSEGGGNPPSSPSSLSSSSSSSPSSSSTSDSSSSSNEDGKKKKKKKKKKKDKVTRKEAERVSVPVYPKMHQLDLWKSQLTMALVTASGDTGHGKWLKWLSPSWSTSPNLDTLNKVKKEYRAIDVKLCLALMSMLKTAGDVARVVRIEVEKLQRHRAKHDKILSGREVIAIIFESFRSSDNADVMFMIDNLINMKYPGDSKIYDFYTQWHAILEGMRAEDVPPKRTLRDILYKKIRDSDPMKTCDLLMSFIVKRIKLDREKKNQQEKEKAWTEITNPKPG